MPVLWCLLWCQSPEKGENSDNKKLGLTVNRNTDIIYHNINITNKGFDEEE